MYNEYFGFREKPFNITPDPRFLYANPSHEEAYANLFYGVRERKGFIVLTGEVGTGKTTLLRRLVDNLEDATRFIFFYNTTLSFEELLDFSFSELDLEAPQGGQLKKIQALNQFLISELAQGGSVALLIDEAQNLSDEVLENLRLLSNLETAQEKLLQIVLVGQPELDAKLAQPHLRQLKQRISTRCHLARLRDAEVGAFVAHRLRTVGYEGSALFSSETLQRLTVYCQGIPRLINVMCDSALLIAYGASQKSITPAMIDEVAKDLQLSTQIPRRALMAETIPIAPSPVNIPRQEERLAPDAAPVLQAKIQEKPVASPSLTLTTNPKEHQPLRSPYVNQRLAWAGVFALMLFCGFIIYNKIPREDAQKTTAQQEDQSSRSTLHGIAKLGQSFNERLAALLTPLLPSTQKQIQPTDASQHAIAQELMPPPTALPDRQDQTSTFTMTADVTLKTDQIDAQTSPQEELAKRSLIPPSPPLSQDQPKARESLSPLQEQERVQLTIVRPPVANHSQERHFTLLHPGETISAAIRTVYGNYNSLALDLIKEFNPQLEDLDRVIAGQRIWFPPLTLDTLLRAQNDGTYHLIVATFRNAVPAQRFAQTLRERGRSMQITARQVSESILLYRVEIISLASQAEAQQIWHIVNPANVFFVAPKTTSNDSGDHFS